MFLFHQVEAVIDKIIEKARTGEIGDGKIFCKCIVLLVTFLEPPQLHFYPSPGLVSNWLLFFLLASCNILVPVVHLHGLYCLVHMQAYRSFLLFCPFLLHLSCLHPSEIEMMTSSCSFKLLVGFSKFCHQKY